ncbi:hypothetical protein [Chryseolinea soli]|uniref:Haem-binding domain-containing protein n=1 Tax=Chryseolinea soli TaxID=2321403 RepID=A0A385SZP6_9BACT|nr:hypothetical protein [Chryseolinea soli]AYB35300.1 hypothetical protein D4L85_34035 [Chryseolinea soli]
MKTHFFKGLMVVALMSVSPLAQANVHPDPVARRKDDTVKDQALMILQGKCNVCHERQNPGKVFTVSNMETHAPKIYKQVFVKQRMPRGNVIKLSQEEKDTLLRWLETQGVVGEKK